MAVIEVNNPIIQGSGASRIREARTALTNAQLLALRATPVTLIAAPGAGNAIIVQGVYLAFDVTTTGYTVGTNDLVVEYSGGSDILTIETVGLLDQTTDQIRQQRVAVALNTPVANEAVQIKNSGGSEFTGGNAANTLNVVVEYVVVPTSF
jgi:hypothetical protein